MYVCIYNFYYTKHRPILFTIYFCFFFLKKRPRMHKQCVVTADAENVLHVFEDKHSLFSQHVCANF